MKEEKIWEITVKDKSGEEQVFKRTLNGSSPPSSETAAALIQNQLVGDRLFPFVGQSCEEPTVYRLKETGFTITSIGEAD